MSYRDLRDWTTQVEELGELKTIRKADWDVEIGVITEIVMNRHGPALLFDEIVGYPAGYRIVANALGGPKRLAYTLGLPTDRDIKELLKLWQCLERLRQRLDLLSQLRNLGLTQQAQLLAVA